MTAMQRRSAIIRIAACAMAVAAACAQAVAGSRSIELYHDDGSAEAGFTSSTGTALAIGFQAPEGSEHILGARIYFVDDGITDPNDPQLPTTAPFTAWVWTCDSGGLPGALASDGYVPFPEYAQYPEEAWVEFDFPEPIDITNPVTFPEGRFFLGLEWDHRHNPVVGLDLDSPIAEQTLHWNWTTWAVVDTADAMVRAVVSDTTASPVEVRSWGYVKGEYR
jgi:hypothetical protein